MLDLREHLLETLSFFDFYSVERIILDMKEEVLLNYPEFTKDNLVELLQELEREKLVERKRVEKEEFWKKIYPQKSWLKRILNLFKR